MSLDVDLIKLGFVVLPSGQVAIKLPTAGAQPVQGSPQQQYWLALEGQILSSIIAVASVTCQMTILFWQKPINFRPHPSYVVSYL